MSRLVDFDSLALSLSGLRPRRWLCVGPGLSREECKEELLKRNVALGPQAVTTPEGIAQWILGVTDKPLSSLQRQRVLKQLLRQGPIRRRLTHLNRLQRRSGFFATLDQSLQSGFMAFADEEQEEVIEGILERKGLQREVRAEVRAFAHAYESYLRAMNIMDVPMLYKDATARIREGKFSPTGGPSEGIDWIQCRSLESRESAFLEELSRVFELRVIRPEPWKKGATVDDRRVLHEVWHSVEDVCEAVATEIVETLESGQRSDSIAVLIPEDTFVRRALRRSFDRRNIGTSDPRDPLSWKSDELVKKLLLPIRVLASGYAKADVSAYVLTYLGREVSGAMLKNLEISGWDGGNVPELGKQLEIFPVRCSFTELEEAWLTWWSSQREISENEKATGSVLVSELVKRMRSEFERVSEIRGLHRRIPIRSWWREFSERLDEESPQIEALKPREGVAVYRFQQWPLKSYKKIFAIELDWNWIRAEGGGDFWLSARERMSVGSEFEVRTQRDQSEDREAVLRAWIDSSDQFKILQAEVDMTGHQRDLHPKGWELLFSKDCFQSDKKGAMPSTHSYYARSLSVPPQEAHLPQASLRSGNRMSATELDRYSRCPFQALIYHRWKLEDLREAKTQMWPDVKGLLLHRLAERLVRLKEDETPESVIQEMWTHAEKNSELKGYISKPAIVHFEKRRWAEIAEVFLKREKDYRDRSGAEPWLIESKEPLVASLQGVEVRGRADRIDRHPDGLFVMDYKTTSNLPHGFDILEKGYRLQLPFYAIAARKKYHQEVLGVQFVSLDKTGGRTRGLMLQKWNGKTKGSLTTLRKDSKNLISDRDPESLWQEIEEKMKFEILQWKNGEFSPKPRMDSECPHCVGRDLCGKNRVEGSDDSSGNQTE